MSLEHSKPNGQGQDFTKPVLFRIGLPMNDQRRDRVLAYFKTKFDDDRQAIIRKTKFGKSYIAQIYDYDKPLGERAGRELAGRLGLDDRYFESDPPEASAPVKPPAPRPPAPDFADRYEVSATDFALLQEINDAMQSPELSRKLDDLRGEARALRRIAETIAAQRMPKPPGKKP